MFIYFDNGSRVDRLDSVHKSPAVYGGLVSVDGQSGKEPETPEAQAAEQAYHQAEDPSPRGEPAVQASRIMTAPVVTLPEDALLEQAWDLIIKRRFRHVPVVSEEGRVKGIISDRDLLAVRSRGADATPRAVRDVMKTKVNTATPDTEIREIARVLFEERIGAMPVVDAGDNLLGIITRSDILRALIRRAPKELWI
jgi:acetoin utilization protein AcuB